MSKRIAAICLLAVIRFFVTVISRRSWAAQPAVQEPAAAKASPAEGYNLHVLASHLVDGKQMGPYLAIASSLFAHS